jgi:hypothetical protein
VADKTWRRFAFRVTDYITFTSQMKMRFYASDSINTNFPNNGQSLVEGALDDFKIWNGPVPPPTSVTEVPAFAGVNVYPNPAGEQVFVNFMLNSSSDVTIEIINTLGQIVFSQRHNGLTSGFHQYNISTENLAEGVYMVNVRTADEGNLKKLTITK